MCAVRWKLFLWLHVIRTHLPLSLSLQTSTWLALAPDNSSSRSSDNFGFLNRWASLLSLSNTACTELSGTCTHTQTCHTKPPSLPPPSPFSKCPELCAYGRLEREGGYSHRARKEREKQRRGKAVQTTTTTATPLQQRKATTPFTYSSNDNNRQYCSSWAFWFVGL